MSISHIVACLVGIASLTGCVTNDCGDGNNQDRGVLQTSMSRASLNDRLRDNRENHYVQWWWCDSTATSVPPIGSGWTSITRDAPRNTMNAVGGWVRPNVVDAQNFGGGKDSWRAAAIYIAMNIAGGSVYDTECDSVDERIDALDRFVECKQPVRYSPAAPGGGTNPTPLPPGSSGGDP